GTAEEPPAQTAGSAGLYRGVSPRSQLGSRMWIGPKVVSARAEVRRGSPQGLAGLPRMKLHSSRAVGTEVGFSLAHSNPFCSWTRDPWSTSPCRHGPSLAPEHVS